MLAILAEEMQREDAEDKEGVDGNTEDECDAAGKIEVQAAGGLQNSNGIDSELLSSGDELVDQKQK